MAILDIHTHHAAPQPEGVISVSIDSAERGFEPLAEQLYSVGIHPWDTTAEISDEQWRLLEEYAALPQVVAIGECGVDLLPKGGPMYRQLQVMKRHVDLSENLHKPLIIHNVKAHDVIIGLHRDLKPTQPWVIHGFRGKREVAQMLVRAGIMLSFGAQFNPDALVATPREFILAETDEFPGSIEEVITRLSAARGEEMRDTIAGNSEKIIENRE